MTKANYKPENWEARQQKLAEFEIIEDMTQIEAGGFKPGARINLLQMQRLLADRMLAKGTRVRYLPTGEERKVDYDGVR